MNIFDSHCHLTDKTYKKELDAVLDNMARSEVRAAMVVGIDPADSFEAVRIAETRPNLFASVGVHPHDARNCSEEALTALKDLAARRKVRAWGETGLDFNRMFSPREAQEKWFLRQLETADELDLPLIFHERDSGGRFLELLRDTHHPGRRGVVHCFSGSPDELAAYLSLGYHVGITGILTIKTRGAELREMAREMPRDRILVETDAPYLTPTPQRNKFRRNEPAFVRQVLIKLAEVREEAPESLADALWRNTLNLFGIDEQALSGAGRPGPESF